MPVVLAGLVLGPANPIIAEQVHERPAHHGWSPMQVLMPMHAGLGCRLFY
jgi:hypothetical protein